MKTSYNWLQDNFEDRLPSPEAIKEAVIMHAFEVESLEEVDALGEKDYLFDIKILPNRAHDCNAHFGIAREVAILLDLKLKQPQPASFTVSPDIPAVKVQVDDTKLCPRYMCRILRDVQVGESPIWLKQRLAAIGQKSINNIVDAANYVMFQTGQPLHVFDADKISGDTIRVRRAETGEKMTTLDGKQLTLDPSMLVIADDKDALALAGIKGGTKAATTDKTKNIILEAANFIAAPIRKTSHKTGIRTDASFRFEHELAPELAVLGMDELTKIIEEVAGDGNVSVGPVTDIYPAPRDLQEIDFTSDDVENLLGIKIEETVIEELLSRFKRYAGFDWKKEGKDYIVAIPPERLDFTCREDIIEELGRVNGYEKIPFTPLEVIAPGPVNKRLYYSELIRDLLANEGFSEVYNYSIVGAGSSGVSVELANPLAADKKFLRDNLSAGLHDKLLLNVQNKDLLGLDQIKIFEIGHVFVSGDERVHCAIAIEQLKKTQVKIELESVIENLKKETGIQDLAYISDSSDAGIIEFDIDSSIKDLPLPVKYHERLFVADENVSYKSIVPFPFVTRDIAVFVPADLSADVALKLITDNAGDLLVRTKLFDQFTKKFEDGSTMFTAGGTKTSYAFRLIFQAKDRTLTGEEVNAIMDKITNVLNGNDGWKVR